MRRQYSTGGFVPHFMACSSCVSSYADKIALLDAHSSLSCLALFYLSCLVHTHPLPPFPTHAFPQVHLRQQHESAEQLLKTGLSMKRRSNRRPSDASLTSILQHPVVQTVNPTPTLTLTLTPTLAHNPNPNLDPNPNPNLDPNLTLTLRPLADS